jgi:putative transcriptional regulator
VPEHEAMLDVTFEFVGGPNDGQIVRGKLGEQSDAHRYYLFSHHGRVGQAFKVASEYAIDALATGAAQEPKLDRFQQHYYVVTDHREDEHEGRVWVRARYAPELGQGASAEAPKKKKRRKRKQPSPQSKGLEHHLLIASPRLEDEAFAHVVTLLIDHGEGGSFGVVLNCPVPLTVSQVWQEIGEPPCDSQHPVHAGGPCDGPVLALHTDESLADWQVLSDVFLAVQKDTLDRVVRHAKSPYRIFVGTASWEEGQLEKEIAQGDWLVLPATGKLVFGSSDTLWHDALQEFGRSFYRSLGVRHLPDDPGVN